MIVAFLLDCHQLAGNRLNRDIDNGAVLRVSFSSNVMQ
jgi:hypothetical protein